jgi:hypothetical protein
LPSKLPVRLAEPAVACPRCAVGHRCVVALMQRLACPPTSRGLSPEWAGEYLPDHFLTDRRQTPALVAVDPPYDTAISLGIRGSAEVIFLQLLAKLALCPRLSYRLRNGRMLSASFSPPAGPCPISSIYTRTGNAAFTTRLITLLPKQFVRQERPSTIGRTRSKKSIRWACPDPKGRH